MTKLNKCALIKAGHDEGEYDIDIDVLGVFDNEEDAKKALKEQVEDYKDEGGYYENDISWDDNETKVTITSDDDYDGWCKVYKIEKI